MFDPNEKDYYFVTRALQVNAGTAHVIRKFNPSVAIKNLVATPLTHIMASWIRAYIATAVL
jgi:hypothetical protein